jgi:hypothetical protein
MKQIEILYPSGERQVDTEGAEAEDNRNTLTSKFPLTA